MINEVTLVGRLARDPELKNLPNGKQVANFSVACEETWKDKSSGEKKTRTEWVRVVCWNEQLNKIIESYLRQGSLVFIRGKLQTREWEKNGEKRYTTEVVMQGFDSILKMLGSKKDRDSDGGERGSSGGGRKPNVDLDDQIPF
jgi:single-strand DNA-binding protein